MGQAVKKKHVPKRNQDNIQISIAIQKALLERVKEAGEHFQRNISQEIRYRLDQSLKSDGF